MLCLRYKALFSVVITVYFSSRKSSVYKYKRPITVIAFKSFVIIYNTLLTCLKILL